MASPSPSPRRSDSRDRSRSRSPARSRSPERRSSYRSTSRSNSRERRRSRSPQKTESAPPSRILGIFGLSADTREQDLVDLLERYGRLESVKLIVDKNTGESKRFGFAYFEEQSDASKAREELNGSDLHGRKVRIDYSLTQGAHTPTPGRYLGKQRQRNYDNRGRYGGRGYDDRRYDDRRYDDRRYDDRRYDDRRDDYRRYDDRRYDDRRDDYRRYDDRRDDYRRDDRRY